MIFRRVILLRSPATQSTLQLESVASVAGRVVGENEMDLVTCLLVGGFETADTLRIFPVEALRTDGRFERIDL